ncbi:MAG: hypothetical protein IJ048_00100 [Clostridia bacterium]|nr:hypothetical protein [Clostridia bacterium]
MRAGYGKYEITPPLGVELGGYGYYLQRRAQSVLDPLFARAVLLEEGAKRALIVSCDLLGLSDVVCDEVFDRVKPLSLAPEDVMLVSVHTHTGPVVKDHEGCGVPDEAYVASLAEKISRAAFLASEDMKEVTGLSFVTRPLGGAQAARSADTAGQAKHGFAAPPENTGFTYNRAIQDGPVDRTARGFIIRRGGDAPIALSNAACHAVFNAIIPDISADYPGEVNRLVDAAGCRSIFLNGACGDIDPAQKKRESRAAFARAIADVFTAEERPLPLTLRSGAIPFELRTVLMSREERHAAVEATVARHGGPEALASKPALVWEKDMLAREGSLTGRETIQARYIILGGVPIASMPFEGYTQIGQTIRALTGREDALVLGCQEEMLGYLPTKDDIQQGGYAALESTYLYRRLPVVPGEAERLGQVMGKALKAALSEA